MQEIIGGEMNKFLIIVLTLSLCACQQASAISTSRLPLKPCESDPELESFARSRTVLVNMIGTRTGGTGALAYSNESGSMVVSNYHVFENNYFRVWFEDLDHNRFELLNYSENKEADLVFFYLPGTHTNLQNMKVYTPKQNECVYFRTEGNGDSGLLSGRFTRFQSEGLGVVEYNMQYDPNGLSGTPIFSKDKRIVGIAEKASRVNRELFFIPAPKVRDIYLATKK